MTAPQFLLAFLVLNAPPLYWIWWLYSKSHHEGRRRRLFVGTAVLAAFIVLIAGWLFVLGRLFPTAGVLTQQAPIFIGLIPVVVALALIFAGIIMVMLQRR